MTLQTNNLYSEAYTQLKNFINDNLTDPKGRYKKNWVHASLPHIADKGFDGYPFFVVSVDLNENNHSFEMNTNERVFRFTISIYSDEATQVDTLADEFSYKLRQDLNGTSISNQLTVTSSSEDPTFPVIGNYIEDGTYNSQTAYKKLDDDIFIFYGDGYWYIGTVKEMVITPPRKAYGRTLAGVTGFYSLKINGAGGGYPTVTASVYSLNELKDIKAKSINSSPLSTALIGGKKIYMRNIGFQGKKRL